MSPVDLVVMAAHGAGSFTPGQRARLERAARVRYVEAPAELTPGEFLEAFGPAEVAGLTPRGTPRDHTGLLAALNRLRAVAIPTTGYEWLDVGEFRRLRIAVANIPGFSSASTAEFTWGLILTLARKLPAAQRRARDADADGDLRGRELWGRQLGVVGGGSVGGRVAHIGLAFGMAVVVADPAPPHLPVGVRLVAIEELFATSDVITLHCPLTASTRCLVDGALLSRTRPGTLLVNTARPALVDPDAVGAWLRADPGAGYAVDLGYEASLRAARLDDLPNLVVVPHVSWYTREAVERGAAAWVHALRALVEGKPCHIIPECRLGGDQSGSPGTTRPAA